MKVIEFADLVDVPILKAGTHNSHNAGAVTITPEELESILEGSNACRELIQESLQTGGYRGNTIKPTKMPSVLNLHHDGLFDETIKERTKGVSVEFAKKAIDGEEWLVETFKGVPHDVAKTLKTHYPFTSVELLPLTHPETGVAYPMVVRSTAFLDRYTPPAVKGQPGGFAVEFAGDDPVLVLFSGTDINPNKRGQIMPDNNTDKKTPETPSVDVSEEKDAEIKELMEQKVANEKMVAELKAAQEASAAQVAELQAKQDASEVREFMNNIGKTPVKGNDGVVYNVSASFLEVIEPIISGTSRIAVIEMEEGAKPARSVLEAAVEKIVELAGQRMLLVPMVEMAGMMHEPPGTQQKTTFEKAKELQASENISYADALLRISQGGN